MADFKPTKIDLSTINNGKGEYNNGDSVQADTINAVVEGTAWVQALGTNQPNYSGDNNGGTPSVSIETLADGTPRLKFKNLKGDGVPVGGTAGQVMKKGETSTEWGEVDMRGISSARQVLLVKISITDIPLLDYMWMKDGSLYTNNEKFKRTDFIEVEPNKEYTLCVYYRDAADSIMASNGKIFDADKNIIADLGDGVNHILTITMPENAKYIQMSVSTDNTNTDLSAANGLAISEMYYQYTTDTKSLDWLRLKKENIPDGLFTGDMLGEDSIKFKQIDGNEEYQYGDNLLDGATFVNGKYCIASSNDKGTLDTISYVELPVEESKRYAITVYDIGPHQNICLFVDSNGNLLHETTSSPFYTFKSTNIAENVFIVKAPKTATKLYLNVLIAEQSTAIVKEATPIHKSLQWLEITGENLGENVVESLSYEIDNRNYKYGDSLNKPFDFTGKTIRAFGDSITQGYTSPNLEVKADSCYIKLFANKFGMTLHNCGIGGSCITDSDDTEYSIYKQVHNYTDSRDFIVISGGTNDFNTGKPLGDYDSTDPKTFYGALRGICEYLKTKFANSTVIFITPIPVTKNYPNAILPLNAYRNAIYEIATIYGFNVVSGDDLGLPKSAGSFANEMITDGCHPTEAGHSLYFRNLCGKLC